MTSPNMLAKLRTLLDEASATFWSDTECYASLADGQREVINFALIFYNKNPEHIPEVLRPLLTSTSSTIGSSGSSASLPASFIAPVSVKYSHTNGTQVPTFIRSNGQGHFFKQANSLLQPVATTPFTYFCYFLAGTIVFETAAATTSGYTLEYLALPTDIASGQNATIPDFTHNAIVQYAYAQLLLKDKKHQEAAQEWQKFMAMLPNLIF